MWFLYTCTVCVCVVLIYFAALQKKEQQAKATSFLPLSLHEKWRILRCRPWSLCSLQSHPPVLRNCQWEWLSKGHILDRSGATRLQRLAAGSQSLSERAAHSSRPAFHVNGFVLHAWRVIACPHGKSISSFHAPNSLQAISSIKFTQSRIETDRPAWHPHLKRFKDFWNTSSSLGTSHAMKIMIGTMLLKRDEQSVKLLRTWPEVLAAVTLQS